jgi:hypothetical protein
MAGPVNKAVTENLRSLHIACVEALIDERAK